MRSTGLLVSFVLALPVAAMAADYPASTVKIVSGFPPGGGSDRVARVVAGALSEKWKVPVVVETQPGADGTIAADIVSKATPDGYTMFWMTSNHVSTPSLRALPFDPVKDFYPITIVASGPQVLTATPSFVPSTVAELIAVAKSSPRPSTSEQRARGARPISAW